jgi:hypothetical protein
MFGRGIRGACFMSQTQLACCLTRGGWLLLIGSEAMRAASLLAPIMGMFLAACSAPAMGPFTVFADPGEYEFHTCEQLAAVRPNLKARAQDLKLLMDKAEKSTGGTVVNVIAYKADYVTVTEQLKVLDATARDKKCAIPADQ